METIKTPAMSCYFGSVLNWMLSNLFEPCHVRN